LKTNIQTVSKIPPTKRWNSPNVQFHQIALLNGGIPNPITTAKTSRIYQSTRTATRDLGAFFSAFPPPADNVPGLVLIVVNEEDKQDDDEDK
jgi:hypothetical protein